MDIQEDVMTEILTHLPVKSLLKFRIVCKSWCNIIDSSTFRKSLQSRNKEHDDDTMFLRFTRSVWESVWELSTLMSSDNTWKSYRGFPDFQKFLDDKTKIGSLYIAGPVDGLICIYNNPPRSESSWSIAICNPCLEKIKILPVSPICSTLLGYGYEYWFSASIYRDIGFGFDATTKDYKVVQLISYQEHITQVEIYSSTSNTWRELVTDGNIFHALCLRTNPIKSTHNNRGSSVHWRIARWIPEGIIEDVILSFNMHSEVFETILFPYSENKVVHEVFAKDDSYVLFVYPWDSCSLEVWELESRGNERCWSHVRDVRVWTPMDVRAGGGGVSWPIALWKSGVVLKINDCRERQSKLIFYDYYKEKGRECFVMPNTITEILEYKCSLVSP